MSTMFDTLAVHQEDLGESVEVPESARQEVVFCPWHKPRKQWVREKQWWVYIRSLLRSRKRNIDSLRYLSLPGKDLMDFHFLRGKLREDGEINLLATGIVRSPDEWETAQTNLSRVNDLEGMHPASNVYMQDLDSFGYESSAVSQKLRSMDAFDVVNLDYCSGLCPKGNLDRFRSIYGLVKHQLDVKRDSWLLLITARTGKRSVNDQVIEDLFSLIQSHILDEGYAAEFSQYYSHLPASPIGEKIVIDRDEVGEQDFSELVVLGFLSWLVPEAIKQGYSLKLNSSARYEVAESDGDDMFSLAVLFKKDPVELDRDHHEILSDSGTEDKRDTAVDPEHAIPLIRKIKDSIYIDGAIRRCPTEYKKLVLSAMKIIEEIGISSESYVEEMCMPDLEAMQVSMEDFKRGDF